MDNTNYNNLLFKLMIFSLMGFIVAGILQVFAGKYLFGNLEQITQIASQKIISDETVIRFMLLQAVGASVIFIITPLFFFNLNQEEFTPNFTKESPKNLPYFILIAAGIFLVSYPFSVFTYEFSSKYMQLPWADTLEKSYGDNVSIFTNIQSSTSLILSIIVIVLLPAFGEELLFRVSFQPMFIKVFKNVHVGILITAIFFSLIHFSFYGFIYRLLAGLILGYLYYYSKNYFIPVIAHGIQNGFSLYLMLIQKEDPTIIHKKDFSFAWHLVLLSLIFTVLLFYLMKMKEERE